MRKVTKDELNSTTGKAVQEQFANKNKGFKGIAKTILTFILSFSAMITTAIIVSELIFNAIVWLIFKGLGFKSIHILLAIFLDLLIFVIAFGTGLAVGGSIFIAYHTIVFKAEKGYIRIYTRNTDGELQVGKVIRIPNIKLKKAFNLKGAFNKAKDKLKKRTEVSDADKQAIEELDNAVA